MSLQATFLNIQDFFNNRIKLFAKLMIVLFLVVSMVLGIGNWVLNNMISSDVKKIKMAGIYPLIQEIQKDIEYWMQKGDMEQINKRIPHILQINGIEGVFIADPNGKIVMGSSKNLATGQVPAQYVSKLRKSRRSVVDEKEERLLFFQPFRARSECLSCHENWQRNQFVGFMGLDLSLRDVSQKSAKISKILSANLFIMLLLIFGVSYLFIYQFISKRLERTVQAANQLANGEWDKVAELDDLSGDEIGVLNRTFLEMSQKLKEMVNQIHHYKKMAEEAQQEALHARMETEKNHQKLEDEIDRITRETQRLLKGDLSIKCNPDQFENIPVLVNHINQLVGDLRNIIAQLRNSSSEISTSAGEIFSAMEKLTDGIKSQEDNTAQVAVAVQEMTKNILETSQNAHAMRELADKTGDVVRQGEQKMVATTESMEQIVLTSSQVDQTLRTLTEKVNKVNHILDIINEIADQTNLLALNAAIEAARAGEQGRGFAVVADEVRRLAERTTESIREIAGTIDSIQSETSRAVETMASAKESVEEGRKETEAMNLLLRQISEHTHNVQDMIRHISVASEQLGAAAEQISQNMTNISEVASEYSPATARITNTAGELYQLTESMINLVRKFKLGEEDRPASDSGNGHKRVVIDLNKKS